ncbi:MAG TPA: pyrroloquinoline quinone biosynthesis peptide chaperone PqqD [Thermodesulfobacteriota bacterium]
MSLPAGPLRLARRAKLRLDPVRRKPLLLVPEGVLVLNRTAHEIVRRIDGTRTAADLAAELTAAAGGEARVAAEVRAFLERLAAKGLLEEVGGAAPGAGAAPRG